MEKNELLTHLSDMQEQFRREVIALRQYLSDRLSKQDQMLNEILNEDVFGRPAMGFSDGGPQIESDAEMDASSGCGEYRRWETQVQVVLDEENHVNTARLKSARPNEVRQSGPISKDALPTNSFCPADPSVKGVRQWLKKCVKSRWFELFALGIIVTNIICVAAELEVEISYKNGENPAIEMFDTLNVIYTFWFLAELLLRWETNGVWKFFTGNDWKWNSLDFIIVVVSGMEFIANSIRANNSSLSVDQLRVFRILRVARICRGVRIIRLVRFVGPLRALLLSIASAMKSLMWTLLLIVLIFFGTGYIIAQTVHDYCSNESEDDPVCSSDATFRYWSSLRRCMLSLFKVVVNGVSWEVPLAPLYQLHWIMAMLFCMYIAFMYFAVLNVVTGIFCQNAIESANCDKEIAVMMKLQQTKSHTETMKKVFSQIDSDHSGDITISEMKQKLDEPEMIAFFESIELDVNDVWAMFCLMDEDKSGLLDVDEFVSGCMLFRGNAKAIHVAKIKYEQTVARSMLVQMQSQICDVQEILRRLTTRKQRQPKAQDPHGLSL